MIRRGAILAALVAIAPLAASGASPSSLPAFERLRTTWSGIRDYSMTIEAHEVLGPESAESELHYAFKRPDHARLDVLAGQRSGATVVWEGGDRVTAYRRPFWFIRIHADARDKNLTSLRGNGILTPNMGDVIACFAANEDRLRERAGPDIDGRPTDEIELPYRDVSCPDDPPADRGTISLDAIDVDRQSGLVVMRKRYQGALVVERWALSGYRINSGLGDRDLR